MSKKYSGALIATGCMFLANGLLNASWVCRIPTVQTQLSLQPEQLGMAMCVQGVGALVAPPLVGKVANAFGTRAVTLASLLAFCLGLLLIPLANDVRLLAFVLGYFGFANSVMDVAMNAQGVAVQKLGKETIMSRLHGLWGVGTMIGAVAGSLAIKAGMSLRMHYLIVALVMIALTVIVRPFLLPKQEESSRQADFLGVDLVAGVTKVVPMPAGVLWLLCAICFLGFLSEAAIADWSPLYLQHTLGTAADFAPIGYAAYSACLALGRFAGDFVIMRLGENNTLGYGALLTACSMAVVLLAANATATTSPLVTVAGLAVAGVGVCALVPIVFTVASRINGITAASAIARVSFAGSLGLLAGPLILGKAAQFFGYPAALVGVMLAQIVIVALALTMAAKTKTHVGPVPVPSK